MALTAKKTGFVNKRSNGCQIFADINVNGRNVPSSLTFAIAQNTTQYGTEIEVSVCNSAGHVIPGPHVLDVWLSDAADGIGVTGTDPAGNITAKANSGVVLGIMATKKAFRVVTAATGKFTLQIIDDVTPVLLYMAASLPSFGCMAVSRKTVAGDYKP